MKKKETTVALEIVRCRARATSLSYDFGELIRPGNLYNAVV